MPSPLTCPVCGAESTGGNFCPGCGNPLAQRTCTACSAPLSPGARFCHRCGNPVAGVVRRQAERRAWAVAGGLALALILLIIWFMVRGASPAAAPDMANAGNSAGAVTPGPAPDISQMTPQERFSRLFERVTRAAQAGDSTQVSTFVPMALGAYAQLPGINNDDRFHAAMLHFMAGDFPGTLALADTIQRAVPTHLFVPLIRGTVAEAQGDQPGLVRNFTTFRQHYAAELEAQRPEYSDHRQLLEQFKQSADSASNTNVRN